MKTALCKSTTLKGSCYLAIAYAFLHLTLHGAIFTNVSPLITPRYLHQAVTLLDGRVLAVGGVSPSLEIVPIVPEIYDPGTGQWTTTEYLGPSNPYYAFSMTVLQNGNVLVVGGSGIGNDMLGQVMVFWPSTGIWTNGPSPITLRNSHTATLLPNGKVLLAGGYGPSGHALTNAELYNPATGTWTNTGSMTVSRGNHRATLLRSGKVMLTGGGLASVDIYDPATGNWSAGAPLRLPRGSHTATLLKDGSVILIGNGSSGVGQRLVERSDPDGREWKILNPFPDPRGGHTTTLLKNGKLLLIGGTGSGGVGGILPTAQLYDPYTDNWSSVPNMNTQRFMHASVLLNDGNVLVIGGAYGASASLRAVELFDAATLPYGHVILNQPERLENGTVQLSFDYDPGSTPRLFMSTNVSAPENAWTEILGVMEVEPGRYQANDSTSETVHRRFYRVRVP